MTSKVLYTAAEIEKAMARLVDAVLARPEPPVLVGIHTHGVPLAHRLAAGIEKRIGTRPIVGTVDITLYRDDLAGRALPQVKGSDVPDDIEGKRVVLVDDVLFTGRTIRAALTELADYGRPQRIELCVLVDRGLRELPIAADYVGFTVATKPTQKIRLSLTETGAPQDQIELIGA